MADYSTKGGLRCRFFGHDWGVAFAEVRWWECSRCGADQLAYARSQKVIPAWDWLEVSRADD